MVTTDRKHYEMLIGGERVDADEVFEIVNPATEEIVATVARGRVEHADRAVEAARHAHEKGEWRRKSPEERATVIKAMAARMRDRLDDFARLEALENGVPIRQATAFHIGYSIAHLDYFGELALRYPFAQASPQLFYPTLADGTIRREPLGVCAGIVPWNFPLLLAVWKLEPALAAGNTCVMRPIGQQLDRMTPEQVIAESSPLWSVFMAFSQLGLSVDRMLAFEPEQMARIFCLVFEELGWGDAGLAISLGASMLPRLTAAKFGNQFLLDHTPESMIGCWGATEPEHGSDVLDANKQIFHPQGTYGRPDCVAKLYDDRVVINGRKSDWISNGTIAQVCILYCAADTGDGPDPGQGCTVIVPLDARGVSRGKPLNKLGQRALNQGAVIFDEVELPLDYVLAGPDDYKRASYSILSDGNAIMGVVFTGAARAAFELALAYAHERKQGGVPIIRHQSVAYRLFHMYRKVEAARALSRRALIYNYTQPVPAMHVAMASKITGTQNSFEVANEALQIFCGKGLIPEYPIEKIFRDTRASLIEDGCNEILAIKGGNYLINPEFL